MPYIKVTEINELEHEIRNAVCSIEQIIRKLPLDCNPYRNKVRKQLVRIESAVTILNGKSDD